MLPTTLSHYVNLLGVHDSSDGVTSMPRRGVHWQCGRARKTRGWPGPTGGDADPFACTRHSARSPLTWHTEDVALAPKIH
ncbi:hypothetical protein PLICRDRAFT_44500 [Plicaturopsis crispa FD-325 SS-3]|nr:hypothetical protein PLICRDRAFT_44500 [Plicaturopsis crispa FD-325 SS-3]